MGRSWGADPRLLGLNNIELITDRDLEVNLTEMKATKDNWPDRAIIASLMVPCEEDPWKRILDRVLETDYDGVELNFGCPYGMSERVPRGQLHHHGADRRNGPPHQGADQSRLRKLDDAPKQAELCARSGGVVRSAF